jgi:membrane protein implicated in regulation of membrane protease activity
MIVVALVTFVLGLVLAVRAMLFGVEKPDPSADIVISEEPPPAGGDVQVRYVIPVLAAYFTVAGATAYVLLRTGTLRQGTAVGIALVAGVVAAALAHRLVRRAVAMVPEHDPMDPRYVLQGHVARVTAPIGAQGDGEVAYELGTTRYVVPARGVDGSTADAGSDVVIERIEDGVAYVEPWAEVEKRL